MLWLIDATVSYSRMNLTISLAEMVRGKNREDGTSWLQPCGLTKATLSRVIAALEDRGLLTRRNTRGRVRQTYTINTEWEPTMRDLPVPKRKMNPGAQKLLPQCEAISPEELPHSEAAIKTGKERGQVKPPLATSASYGRVGGGKAEEAIARVINRPKKKPSPDQRRKWLKNIWEESWKEGNYGSLAPTLTAKDRGQLGKAVDRWPDKGEAVARWAITNWREIMAKTFAWMTDHPPPNRPAVGFLLKFIDKFNEAFAEQEFAASNRGIDALGEEAEFKRMIETGMSVEQAWKEMGKREQARESRHGIDAERRKVQQEYRALEQDRAQIRARPSVTTKPQPDVPEIKISRDWSGEDPIIPTDFGEWDEEGKS